ncbi:hypothetical protein KAU19_07440 [Candidatus Parcubacteria bacterium]|nr:hypothetical protein [Candidatus Parcubacteria bacterium]
MGEKPIFAKIKEAEAILGKELSEIKQMDRKPSLVYCWGRALAIISISRERYIRPFTEDLEWLNKATCPEKAFDIYYKAVQTICNHLNWEIKEGLK